MGRDQIDGLIAHTPINQYYLSNYWGQFNSAGGYDGAYLSLLPANEPDGAALIIPALELRRLETVGGTWMSQVFSYFTDADDRLRYFDDGTPMGQTYLGWRPTDDQSDHFTHLEHRWMAAVDEHGPNVSPNAFWALARSIKSAGLERARLASDDPRVGDWLASCNLDHLEIVYRPQLFNEIRAIKTTDEILLMEQAAKINEHALLAAATGMREGMTWAEVEALYFMDMAKHAGQGVYLLCGLGGLPAGEVRRGEPIMMDALGHYQRYHGDFGRCVVVGEPSEKHRRYHAAICRGWEVAQSLLKPGVKFSDVSTKVGDAVRKSGIANFRDPIVHSVGLEHTDDPKPMGVMPQTKGEQYLAENMVVNVDLPHTEIGWGSVHMEDTVVITATGYRRLSSASTDLIVVDAD